MPKARKYQSMDLGRCAPNKGLAVKKIMTEVIKQCTTLLIDQKVTLKSGTTQVSQVDFVRKFIDHHFSRQISLNDLAANSYMDKFHLVRKFKESYGSTPIDYLLERRISAAETLIKMTSHTLEEIAKIVGFNSQAYFCKVFKERRGLSPSVYRRSAHREKMTAD